MPRGAANCFFPTACLQAQSMDLFRCSPKLACAVAASLAFSAALPRRAAAAGEGEIKIGATLPLTGAEARVGGFYKEGYEYAFEQQKNKGGLTVGGKKVPVSLVLLDDTTTQQTA